jgi:hypothetical protein
MLSATTSRRDQARLHPAVPIVIPSEIAIVLSSIGRAAGRAMPSLTWRPGAQVEVARHRLDPGRGDADDRLGQVVVGVTDALQLGARGGAARALR